MYKTIFQVIHCLISSSDKRSRSSIMNMLFLIDKYMLVRFGHTMTDSDYYLGKAGPVSLQAQDVLDKIEGVADKRNQVNIDTSTIIIKSGLFVPVLSRQLYCDELSVVDEGAIKHIAFMFGKRDDEDLTKYIFNYPECQRKNRKHKRIKELEMFSIIDNELGVTKEEVEDTKDLLMAD